MNNESNNKTIRITIDKMLFDIIQDQVIKMNKACYGVLDIKYKKNNNIYIEASKIVALKYLGKI